MKRSFWQVRNAAAISAAIAAAAFGQSSSPTITALDPPAQTAQSPSSFTLTLTGTNFCYLSTINFNGTSHPANVTGFGTASATIAATEITTPGMVPVTYTATLGADCTDQGQTSAPFNFTINPPLTLAPSSLPNGTVGSSYNQTLTATGGTPPYSTPMIATGNPPPGITTSPGTLNISFTPATATTYTFNVGVTDNGGGTISPMYSLTVGLPVSLPASIAVFAGSNQAATVNTAFATALQAIVKDRIGNPLANIAVTFGAPGSGASGTFGGSPVVMTNGSGVATAPVLTANATAGAFIATATVSSLDTPANFSLTNNPAGPPTITTSGGSPQAATINTAFATPLQVTVKDASGNLVPNAPVTFSAPASGASGSFAASATVNTNSSGVAVAPRFTANSVAGSYAVTATTAGATTPASFSLTNNPGAPATITATGGAPQSAAVGTQFAAPLQAMVKDAGGNPVPGAQVTFTLPSAPVSAVFAGGQSTAIALTNASGVAISPAFTANASAGSYNAVAAVTGVAAATQFALNNTSSVPPPPNLSITTSQLPTGAVGTAYSAGISATGGTPPYSFSISSGSLEAGLSLNASGSIGGIPTAAGTQVFLAQVTDGAGATSLKGLTLVVVNALAITTGSNLPDARVGQSYTVTFLAIGGQPGYTWSISGGSASPSDDPSAARLATASAGLPPGLTFTSSFTSATLSGTPTAAGSFSFSVQVTDTAQGVAFKSFSLSSLAPGAPGSPTGPIGPNQPPGVLVSQTGLTFQGPQGGNPPAPQYLSIVATNNQPLVATITVDGGSPGTPAPAWLKARFVSAITPARLAVQVMPTGLTAGAYQGRVLVTYQGQPTIVVNVAFTVDLTPPALAVAPGFLRFTAISGVADTAQQALVVNNLGTGGPLNFTASVVSDSPWLSVTPASGTTVVGSGVPLQVAVNTAALKVGAYLGKIHVAGPVGGSVDVPVSLFVSEAGPSITVNPVGVRFDARVGNGLAIPLPVTVLNSGTGTVNWTADLLAGQSWLTLSPAAGQATPTVSSQLTATANPTGLAAGAYYGLIRISDPQSLNSPQYATAVLNVQAAAAGPDADMEPGGLFFTAAPGGSAPGPQALQVFVSSDTPAAFQAAASSDDGASWLSIGQQSGTASTHTPGQITVSVNPAGLKPGVYTGDVSVSFSSQTIRTANITLVVLAAGGSAAPSPTGKDRRALCAPSQLSLTSTSLVNAFASPAGWPAPLTIRATDDCGNGAPGAQVVATFSNGDPPLSLSRTDPTAALFSGTWAPKNMASQMTVTINGFAPGLPTAKTLLTGTVGGNTAPSLSPNGTLNNLNPAPGAAVAPGTVAQVFGGALTPSTSIPGLLPLPTVFNGTSVLIGAFLAPLYSLSDGQLDVQIPTELTPNRQYAILVSSAAAFTLPDTLTTTDASPGLLNFAQHTDFTTISATSPATAGDTILLYLVGMGATDPTVASGAVSPTPAATVTNTPLVTISGQSATVSFAGLTPGLVGLYQINVQVPSGTPSGDASVTVTQNGTTSNTVTIPVQ